MADIRRGRWTAEIEGDFVVFLIGARVNSKLHALKILRDLGGRRGMTHMLQYLTEHPDKGLLGCESVGFTFIQYWRSFEHLEAFAGNADDPHSKAWRTYWTRVGTSTRAGIWHETYFVRAGEYETIYANMPPHGLGRAVGLVPLAGATSARRRLRTRASSSERAVEPGSLITGSGSPAACSTRIAGLAGPGEVGTAPDGPSSRVSVEAPGDDGPLGRGHRS